MSMWNHLPLGELHRTPNFGCAGGVCEGRYANVFHLQAQRRIEQIEGEIAKLREDDPTGYYQGDVDELLEAHRQLTLRLKGAFS
jgi:hypothetical protein